LEKEDGNTLCKLGLLVKYKNKCRQKGTTMKAKETIERDYPIRCPTYRKGENPQTANFLPHLYPTDGNREKVIIVGSMTSLLGMNKQHAITMPQKRMAFGKSLIDCSMKSISLRMKYENWIPALQNSNIQQLSAQSKNTWIDTGF
jgi:hypothetical protein